MLSSGSKELGAEPDGVTMNVVGVAFNGLTEAVWNGTDMYRSGGCGIWGLDDYAMRLTICYQNLHVAFSIYGIFTDVPVNRAMGSNTPPCHHRFWLLNFPLI
ncbi:hypothetical protein XENOCAPTIV_015239 [Xenoophorus captivus]|uniref:Uncharacterized protein n=1 Tax=Xenoophorus captivus TaxID=1517983 RepID=A0ABV0QRY9_9TELE